LTTPRISSLAFRSNTSRLSMQIPELVYNIYKYW
jgi:hypothetical protein